MCLVLQLEVIVVSAALELLRVGRLQHQARYPSCPFLPRQWAIIGQKVKEIIHGSRRKPIHHTIQTYSDTFRHYWDGTFNYPNNFWTKFEYRYIASIFGCRSMMFLCKQLEAKCFLNKDDAIRGNLFPFHEESGLTWDPNAIANEAGHVRQHVVGVIWHATGCMVEKALQGMGSSTKGGYIVYLTRSQEALS